MESFNGKLRDEYHNEHLFLSLVEARTLIEAWRIDYIPGCPTSQGELEPVIYAQQVRKYRPEALELCLGSAHLALNHNQKERRIESTKKRSESGDWVTLDLFMMAGRLRQIHE